MTPAEALAALGAHGELLAADERDRLDRDGFLILHDVVPPKEIARLRARVDELNALARTDETLGAGDGRPRAALGGDDVWLSDLVNQGPEFRACYTHPRVLAAMCHVLGDDIKLVSVHGLTISPGSGGQALHQDWPLDGAVWDGTWGLGHFWICNSIWMLDDFTVENGATRVVPGSHLLGRTPSEALADPEAPHPDQIQIVAPAGSVGIFNSHLWHGASRNTSDAPRRALHSAWTLRDQPQQEDQREYLTPATSARLSDAERVLLDVD